MPAPSPHTNAPVYGDGAPPLIAHARKGMRRERSATRLGLSTVLQRRPQLFGDDQLAAEQEPVVEGANLIGHLQPMEGRVGSRTR